MPRVLLLMSIMAIGCAGCNSNPSPVTSGDSSIHAIDPKGTIRDTSRYNTEPNKLDSGNFGVTH